jgi:Tfp pilus assembly protein PilX
MRLRDTESALQRSESALRRAEMGLHDTQTGSQRPETASHDTRFECPAPIYRKVAPKSSSQEQNSENRGLFRRSAWAGTR